MTRMVCLLSKHQYKLHCHKFSDCWKDLPYSLTLRNIRNKIIFEPTILNIHLHVGQVLMKPTMCGWPTVELENRKPQAWDNKPRGQGDNYLQTSGFIKQISTVFQKPWTFSRLKYTLLCLEKFMTWRLTKAQSASFNHE